MKPKKSLVGNAYRQLQDKFDTRYLKKSSNAQVVTSVNMKPVPIPIIGGGGSYNNPTENPLDVVESLNSLIGDLNIKAGTGISVTDKDPDITIANTGVTSVKGLTGAITLSSTDKSVTITDDGKQNIDLSAAGSSGGVTSLNKLVKDLTLVASTNIKIQTKLQSSVQQRAERIKSLIAPTILTGKVR
jgi:hypothetical protein